MQGIEEIFTYAGIIRIVDLLNEMDPADQLLDIGKTPITYDAGRVVKIGTIDITYVDPLDVLIDKIDTVRVDELWGFDSVDVDLYAKLFAKEIEYDDCIIKYKDKGNVPDALPGDLDSIFSYLGMYELIEQELRYGSRDVQVKRIGTTHLTYDDDGLLAKIGDVDITYDTYEEVQKVGPHDFSGTSLVDLLKDL